MRNDLQDKGQMYECMYIVYMQSMNVRNVQECIRNIVDERQELRTS